MSSLVVTTQSESDSEAESDSSTIVYDHQPFEAFKTRVLELCQTVLAPSNGEISIERLRGGAFNRIIGISILGNESGAASSYVLRIPRFEAAQLERDLAPLQLLRQRGNIKVPRIIGFDTSLGNALESPYMVQERLAGSSLFPGYPDMPHVMKCAIAKELGKVFSELHSIRSVAAGSLTFSPSQESIMIQPFHDPDTSGAAFPYQDGTATQGTHEMLCATLIHKRNLSLAKGPKHTFKVSLFSSFITIASEMNTLGILDANYYCLCHLDLEPRNILAQAPTATHPEAITGILDWDSALFAPPFMSCSPPMWLWAWNDENDEDERFANDMPLTPKFRELKVLFEDAAGLTYKQFAYEVKYRLARRLVRFASEGWKSNEDLGGAESLLREWDEMKGSLKKSSV